MVVRCVWTEMRWAGVFIDTWQIKAEGSWLYADEKGCYVVTDS